MSNARNFIPLPSAIAAGTVVRVGGSLAGTGRSDMAHPTVPFPIYRGADAVIAWPEFPPGSRRDPDSAAAPACPLRFVAARLRRVPALPEIEAGITMRTLQRKFGRLFRGLWRNPEFMKLWMSLTITSFGAQITNLALPLTAARAAARDAVADGRAGRARDAAVRARVSLHAGVLIDRVRKLPIVIAADVGRGVALLAIPVAAYFGALSIEILYVVGFLCGVQNVVGGAAYQVLLAQMAGREPAGRGEREGRARRDVVRAGRARARRRADPARDRAVRDRARRAARSSPRR